MEITKTNEKNGISLITIIITIIVIIILSGAVILILTSINPINQANKAKFIQDVASFQDELNLWISNEYTKTLGEFDSNNLDSTKIYGKYKNLKIQEIIKSMSNKYADIFEIQKGKLVYIGVDEEVEKWVKENGLEKGEALITPYTEAEITDMIQTQGYIPVASANELNNIRYSVENTFGAGTIWENTYTGGTDKKYIQVKDVDLSIYSTGIGWQPIGGITEAPFQGVYDGNSQSINNLFIDNNSYGGIFGVACGDFKNIYIKNGNLNNTNFSGFLIRSICY